MLLSEVPASPAWVSHVDNSMKKFSFIRHYTDFHILGSGPGAIRTFSCRCATAARHPFRPTKARRGMSASGAPAKAAECPFRGCSRHCLLVGEPDRQAPATLTQARVIRRPVGHLALLLRNMVATRSVGLERHDRIRIRTGDYVLSQPNPRHQSPIRATMPP
jgi:hypothetical protein